MSFKIMFVCTGNICRSPMAHAILEHKLRERDLNGAIATESSGTTAFHVGEDVDPRAQGELRKHGVEFRHAARDFRTDDLEAYDLILTMDRSNYRGVTRMANARTKHKVHMFRDFDPEGSGEVPDPYYGGNNGFGDVYEMIDRTADAIIDHALAGEQL